MTAPALARLLLEHPFADDAGLLYTAERSMTRADAVAAALATADRLRALGVRQGQGVAVRLPNGPEFVTSMMGIWLAGAVLVPVNPRMSERELDSVLRRTDPAALVGAGGTHLVEGSRSSTAHLRARHGLRAVDVGNDGDPEADPPHAHRVPRAARPRPRPPAGGRSGREPRRPPTPNLIPVSLALNAGLYNALFGLRAGAALVIMDGFSTTEFQRLVDRFAIRSTVLPPAAITSLNDDPAVESLSPLRYVRSITAPLSPRQARRFRDKFSVFVLNGYGQAEIGEVIGWTAADATDHAEKIGSIGRPHPGVQIKIVDEGSVPVTPGHTGELLVRPPSMAAGYASDDDLSERLDGSGFLRTGDLARVDPDGFVWLEGRVSDVINRGGNKVHPEEVEEVLRLAPGVLDAAVVGASDERLGQVPVAYLVTSRPVSDAELREHCRSQLTPYKVPTEFLRTESLPRNEAGKLLRSRLTPSRVRPVRSRDPDRAHTRPGAGVIQPPPQRRMHDDRPRVRAPGALSRFEPPERRVTVAVSFQGRRWVRRQPCPRCRASLRQGPSVMVDWS